MIDDYTLMYKNLSIDEINNLIIKFSNFDQDRSTYDQSRSNKNFFKKKRGERRSITPIFQIGGGE